MTENKKHIVQLRRVAILFLIIFLNYQNSWGQVIYFQDNCKCGVTGAGAGINLTYGTVIFNVHIEPGSAIRKAYLFAAADGEPDDITIQLNGISYDFNNSSIITSGFLSNFSSPPPSSIHALDITNDILPTTSNYSITAPNQDFGSQRAFGQYYLFIVYENPSLQNTAINVILNNQNVDPFIHYNIQDINPISNGYDFGLSLVGKFFCDTVQDGTHVFINGNYIGLTGGEDLGTIGACSGVQGHFYYQNNLLFGLNDDTSNPYMSGTDALANIQTYLNYNDSHLDLEFNYQTPSNLNGSLTNPILGVYLAYTTLCDTFSVTTPKDTTLCQGTTLQLNATGGTPNNHSASGYEWSPATGLSCTDCPNPIFTADSSMFYTVRIWNTDSCSIVRPLKINVRNTPFWDTARVENTVCGASAGSVTLYASPNNSTVQTWSEVGSAMQSTNVFQNLSGGNHTFYFSDTNGCQSADTVIFIPSTKPTVASFNANPLSGASPLSVDFVNTSQHATNYEWSVNGINLGNSLPNLVFDTSGSYWVELVAWQNDPVCADTFVLQIIAYDSLVLQIPNVFSPDGDGINEYYTLESNVPVSVNYSIVNRWGQTMITKTVLFGPGKTVLWDASNSSTDITEGTYFYSIEATPTFESGVVGETVRLSGFLQVVR